MEGDLQLPGSRQARLEGPDPQKRTGQDMGCWEGLQIVLWEEIWSQGLAGEVGSTVGQSAMLAS